MCGIISNHENGRGGPCHPHHVAKLLTMRVSFEVICYISNILDCKYQEAWLPSYFLNTFLLLENSILKCSDPVLWLFGWKDISFADKQQTQMVDPVLWLMGNRSGRSSSRWYHGGAGKQCDSVYNTHVVYNYTYNTRWTCNDMHAEMHVARRCALAAHSGGRVGVTHWYAGDMDPGIV